MAIASVAWLNSVPEGERARAMERFRILQPFPEDGVRLRQVARQHGLSLRTARRWVMRYREQGLAGLCRKEYAGKGQHRLPPDLQQAIEGLALQKPPLSIAAVQRKAALLAEQRREPVLSYATVYQLVRRLEPALVTLAHEGSKVYSKSFGLVHRAEAEASNAIWQADHTELDILVKDECHFHWILAPNFCRIVALVRPKQASHSETSSARYSAGDEHNWLGIHGKPQQRSGHWL